MSSELLPAATVLGHAVNVTEALGQILLPMHFTSVKRYKDFLLAESFCLFFTTWYNRKHPQATVTLHIPVHSLTPVKLGWQYSLRRFA